MRRRKSVRISFGGNVANESNSGQGRTHGTFFSCRLIHTTGSQLESYRDSWLRLSGERANSEIRVSEIHAFIRREMLVPLSFYIFAREKRGCASRIAERL